jgi:hypothetical protein
MPYADPNDYWDMMPDDEKQAARRQYAETQPAPDTVNVGTSTLKMFGFCIVCKWSGPVVKANLVKEPLDDWICSRCLLRAKEQADAELKESGA